MSKGATLRSDMAEGRGEPMLPTGGNLDHSLALESIPSNLCMIIIVYLIHDKRPPIANVFFT